MVRRLIAATLVPLGLLLALVALAPPSQAASGCVTRAEYQQVSRGMAYPAVERAFGAHRVNAASGGAGAVVWTYRACDRAHRVLVTYQVPVHGPGTLYTKRWV